MKICYVADIRSIHTQRWCWSMGMRGHDIHVISPVFLHMPGVHVHVVERLPTDLRYRGRLYEAINAGRMRRLVRRMRPDVVHVQYVNGTRDNLALGGMKGVIASVWGSDVVEDPGSEPTPRERHY